MSVHMICIHHPCYLHSLRNSGNERRSCSTRTRLQIYCSTTVSQNEGRQLANYQPTSRTYDNVKSFKIEYDVDESRKQRARRLKEKVEAMLGEEEANPLKILELIDDLHRLGISYLFNKQINRAFQRIVSKQEINHKLENSLHATCLFFRLSREYGYDVSQDVFEKFKDGSDKFKCPSEDVQLNTFLSLYEASHLALEGENIMDEAKAFTSAYLKGLKRNINSGLVEEIDHALELPPHYRASRLEARRYINAYGKRSDANRLLLELAKLDFNMVQSTLQRELRDMSGWWEDIGLGRKLSFAKVRVMECFFWGVGMVPEPQFSECRMGLAKALALISAIDDVYDVYGSLEELQRFTHAVERWDLDVLETLPDCMKLSFLALYNTVNEMAYDILEEQSVNIIPHLSRAWADLCKAFLLEAKWCFNKHTPPLEEYLDNGWISASGIVLLTHAYFWMSKDFTKNSLEKLDIYHPLIRDSSMIFRLCNDLAVPKDELEGDHANSILCCMKESGVSDEVARKHIRSLADEAWKRMNKHRLANDSPFEKPFIETAINLARIAECTYQNGDGLRDADMHAKNRISSVIFQPLELTE